MPGRTFLRTPAVALLAGALALTVGPAVGPPAAAVNPSTTASAAERGADAERTGGSLRYWPKQFVGGQALTFAGRLPGGGKRRISLQKHMNRPGDSWGQVPGSTHWTRPNGSFRFRHEAPAMWGISFRVVAQRSTTPRVNLTAKTQDLTLRVSSGDTPYRAPAGEPFTIAVDTTPRPERRPDVAGVPVFKGRKLTLQKRGADFGWRTVGTTRVRAGGTGYFTGLEEDSGTVVYRVRQENHFTGGNRVGWYPSFPTYVAVGDASPVTGVGPQPSEVRRGSPRGPKGASQTAGSRHRWGGAMWDFTWEEGQSLTSRPSKGRTKRGYWQDHSTGTGRVATSNGALALDSGRVRGPGGNDLGDVHATLRGNARAYGRWEARMRARTSEGGGGSYRIIAELVPASTARGACGGRGITIAEVSAGNGRMSFGARSGSQRWQGTNRVPDIEFNALAVAVQVTRQHITWFLNGQPIGTLRNRSAISSAAKTLRFRMVGQGERQMNQTLFVSDWQRGYGLDRGRLVTGGGGLRASRGRGC